MSKRLHCQASNSESSLSSSVTAKNSEEDCRLMPNKRKSSPEQESVRKRQRVATSEPITVAVETGTVLVSKRKTKSEAAAHKKRYTSQSTRKTTEQPGDQVLEKGLKREASPERQDFWRMRRDGNNATATTEVTSVAVESIREADQLMARVNLRTTESESQYSTGASTSQLDSIPQSVTATRADFEAKYHQLHKLGEGGFGSVYAGKRKTDNLPVAIKHIPLSDVDDVPLVLHGQTHMTPLEVLLMAKVAGNPMSGGQSAAVSLLDWYRLDQEVLLVMERPVPSMDLLEYLLENGPLEEDTAKNIMKQLIEAAITMHSARVFHRDLKSENVLIQTVSGELRVQLIDFGCGCIVEDKPYSSFDGTSSYAPPEFYLHGTYEAGPTTVWQLGALLYEVLDGSTQFSTIEFLRNHNAITKKLSQNCQDFLMKCLDPHPKLRATLEQMQSHPWLKDPAQETTTK